MKSSFNRVLWLSLALSLLVIVLVFIWSLPEECCQFRAVSWQALVMACGLVFCTFLCGGWRLVLLHHDITAVTTATTTPESDSEQPTLKLSQGIQAHILGLFSAAITPSGTGHVPMVALSLNRAGLPQARAWSIAVYTSILDLFSFAWLLPTALLILLFGNTEAFPMSNFGTGYKIAILAVSLALFIIGYLINHHIQVLENALRWLCRHSFLRRWYKKIRRFSQELFQRMQQLSQQSLQRHLYIQMVNSLMHISGFCILWVLLWGVQIHVPFLETTALTFLLLLLSFVVPTPGGSGYLEASASLLVGHSQAIVLVLTAVVLWRFLTHYANIILGLLLGGRGLLAYVQDAQDASAKRQKTATDQQTRQNKAS